MKCNSLSLHQIWTTRTMQLLCRVFFLQMLEGTSCSQYPVKYSEVDWRCSRNPTNKFQTVGRPLQNLSDVIRQTLKRSQGIHTPLKRCYSAFYMNCQINVDIFVGFLNRYSFLMSIKCPFHKQLIFPKNAKFGYIYCIIFRI